MPANDPFSNLRLVLRRQILEMLSGDPDGEPAWVRAMSEGSDKGYFGPKSAVWHVNGHISVIVGGIRALLMQTLHPGAMAGVHDHSRYATDPLGRLSGTVRWVVTTTFGSTETVRKELTRVEKMHSRVKGSFQTEIGDETLQNYSAQDLDLITWVHVVFTDAFLGAHQVWGDQIPAEFGGESGADRYVREWSKAGELMGLTNPPKSLLELERCLANFQPVLRSDERVQEAVSFLKNPPIPLIARVPYWILMQGAISTLRPIFRSMLGLKSPRWPAPFCAGLMLRIISRTLGTESTSRKRAVERIERLKK